MFIVAQLVVIFFLILQEDADLDDIRLGATSPVTSQPAPGQQTAGEKTVFAMPAPPPAYGVNPFTGAPVAANESTSLNTSEQTTYTPGI